MGNKGYSRKNMWGGYNHYDSKGHKIGSSDPNLIGGYKNYDAKGHRTGDSHQNMWGGYNHYDMKGNKTGYSSPNLFGGYDHYDSKGKRISSSDPGVFNDYSNSSSDGCYIATCVYGSYDTPEVWTLRRFRDRYLGARVWGRAFIRAYYAVSPKLVSVFGKAQWFRKFWLSALDRFVAELHRRGYEDAPYMDINRRNNGYN